MNVRNFINSNVRRFVSARHLNNYYNTYYMALIKPRVNVKAGRRRTSYAARL